MAKPTINATPVNKNEAGNASLYPHSAVDNAPPKSAAEPTLLAVKDKRPLHVFKVGGAHLDDVDYIDQLVTVVRGSLKKKARVVLVHGGGKEIGQLHDALKIPFKKSLGLRVTSSESMDLVTMTLSGLVNKRVVAQLNHAGLNALGVSGADAGMMHAEFLNLSQLGRVGGPPRVDVAQLNRLLSVCDVLVVAPVCVGPDGDLVNVNADLVGQALAVAMGAEHLDFITDVAAVKTDTGHAAQMTGEYAETLIHNKVIKGGMIPKIQASLAALEAGVGCVRIGNVESLAADEATVLRA